MDAGLLPVKRFDRAKQRLGEHFDAAERVSLAEAMLSDAFELCAAADFLSWWVVSDEATVLKRAQSLGFETVDDHGADLNAALRDAATTIARAGARSVAIVPVDIPLADASDLRDLVDTGGTSDLVIVPSRRDGGTNALFMRPPDLIAPMFGPSSLQRHIEAADSRGLRCSILSLSRLALDIDTIDDIDDFLDNPLAAGTRTREVLVGLRVRD
jgi:2-phospho-L-lactate guanylyltransferase